MKGFAIALKTVSVAVVALLILSACGNGKHASNASGSAGADGSNGTAEGSGQAPNEKVTLKIMFQKGQGEGPDPLYDWMQENVRLYEEKHPNVKFDVIANTSSDNYLTVITTEMAANNLPDIFQGWTLERMRPFAESGRIYDLSDAIASYPDWQQHLSAEGLKATTFNGKVYGLPLEQAVEVVFYNKKVFADHGLDVPKTYDDFLHIVDVLRKDGIVPMTVPNKEPWVGSIPYMTLFERIGGLEAYEKTVIRGEGKWTDEPFIQAGNLLKDLINRGAFDKNVNSITMEESEIKLAEGKAGMYMQGSWSIPSMIRRLGDNLGFFQFPDIDGGKGSSRHFIVLPNSALSISKDTKHPEEAIDFLKFVFSQDRQLELAKAGYLTSYKTATSEGDIPALNHEILDALNQATGYMYPWDVPLGVFMGKELNNTTQSIYTGVDPKTAFERLQQTAENRPKS
jgi:raffinose/stachyose/melibiose transport system substrate-binding protein